MFVEYFAHLKTTTKIVELIDSEFKSEWMTVMATGFSEPGKSLINASRLAVPKDLWLQ